MDDLRLRRGQVHLLPSFAAVLVERPMEMPAGGWPARLLRVSGAHREHLVTGGAFVRTLDVVLASLVLAQHEEQAPVSSSRALALRGAALASIYSVLPQLGDLWPYWTLAVAASVERASDSTRCAHCGWSPLCADPVTVAAGTFALAAGLPALCVVCWERWLRDLQFVAEGRTAKPTALGLLDELEGRLGELTPEDLRTWVAVQKELLRAPFRARAERSRCADA